MKVLIISHNVISTTNNMGKTLKSLFSEFKKEELCQLYIHPMCPDVDVCSSYYCITDEAVLRSLVKRCKPGYVLNKESIINDNQENIGISQEIVDFAKTNSSNPLKRLLRDLVWKLSKWNNEKLDDWLKIEKPTCIFLAPGYAKFIYDIALFLSYKLNIPIITYICDDYYFVNDPRNIVEKIQVDLLRKKIDQLFNRTVHLVAISEEIKKTYVDKFEIESTIIMTGTNVGFSDESSFVKENLSSLSYFGNIGCNRFVSLKEIGNALDEINYETESDFKLKIYTSEDSEDILKVFEDIKSIQMCGFVSGDEFKRVLKESELLLHVEAFDEESINLVKASISTKIADSLCTGIPLIAYGPMKVASIKYLHDNKCAFCISEKIRMKSLLRDIFMCDEYKRREIVKNALNCAEKNHNTKVNSRKLRDILNNYENKN